MMKKWVIAFMGVGILFTACKSDDDYNEPSVEDQNQMDDEAILAYLHDHYFDPTRGLIKKYDDTDSTDDAYPNLYSQGTKLPSGVWIVKREGVVAEGRAIQDNTQDSILISYDSKYFVAKTQDLPEGQKPYNNHYDTFFNTIYTTGTPAWDPFFYYTHVSNTMADEGINLSHYVIEGFIEGLKHFNSRDNSGTDLYDFQGAILVPSRAAYGRDLIYVGGNQSYMYRNFSFVFNFEIHKVIDRNN